MVHPVVVGTGKRLFGEDAAGTILELPVCGQGRTAWP